MRSGLFWIGLSSVCAVWLGVVWGWDVAPVTLTVDDAFYALQTARHIAQGHGPTFDGWQPTNGFHPLWEMLLVPLAALLGAHADAFVRAVLTLQLALLAGG